MTILTFSEFGRRAAANALGRHRPRQLLSTLLVIGDNVKGGFYGQAPDLNDLDGRGDPKTHVDFRSVYASVLGHWLDADVSRSWAATYEDLHLFTGDPGEAVTGPITTGRWVPFATSTALVQQQYRDFLGREGDAGRHGLLGRTGSTRGTDTISQVILHFLDSSGVRPVDGPGCPPGPWRPWRTARVRRPHRRGPRRPRAGRRWPTSPTRW